MARATRIWTMASLIAFGLVCSVGCQPHDGQELPDDPANPPPFVDDPHVASCKNWEPPSFGDDSGAQSGNHGHADAGMADASAASDAGAGNSGARKDDDDPEQQVWQRDKTHTILSKVSVGGGKYLTLKNLRVTVRIDGPRARTIIDHIYENPFDRALEGKFKYTLPPNASVSYYGMFVGQQMQTPRFFSSQGVDHRALAADTPQAAVSQAPQDDWGTLREGRLVGAVRARQVFEEITRRRVDPALLEQEAPNTFTGRVFPIPAKGYNRVVIAYEQTLPQIGDDQVYRFAFPPEVAETVDFAVLHNGQLSTLRQSNLEADLRCKSTFSDGFVRCEWQQTTPDKDAILTFSPKRKDASWLAGKDPTDGQKYLFGQLRVQLPAQSAGEAADQAIFMLDTSLSETPDRFAANVKLLQKILEKNPTLKRFNVLLFDVGAQWANPKGWLDNSVAGRQQLLARINNIVLEGATSFASALNAAAAPAWLAQPGTSADIFVLSDGQLNWGQQDLLPLLHRFERDKRWGTVRFFAYQLGIGSENIALFHQLTRRGGAVFSCQGPAELDRCAVAHTQQAMQLDAVEIDGIDASEILVAGRKTSLYPGALLTFGARYQKDGDAKVTLKGRFLGKPMQQSYVLPVRVQGDLAPRGWAELAIAQLLELDDPKLDALIIAYAQHFRIPNKLCSFLVLETDEEYDLYEIKEQRQAQRVTDVAHWIDAWLTARGAPISERERWVRRLTNGLSDAKQGVDPTHPAFVALSLVEDAAFELPAAQATRLWTKDEVPETYLDTRLADSEDFGPFVSEALRRLPVDILGAMRSLSSIVELHPGNPQGLRLVGYYLRNWNRPIEATRVFLDVLERRSFEPHSYRDVARSLTKLERFGLAAALYEIVLDREWDERFGKIKTIAQEEYALLIQAALAQKDLAPKLRTFLEQRRAAGALSVRPSKLRATITWNTDNTDIDLWVIEPNGEKCYYGHPTTSNNGKLLEDITQGYGPERYEIIDAPTGCYKVMLHFFGHRTNVLGNETHATVDIILNAGSDKQRRFERTLVLKDKEAVVDVLTVSPDL